MKSLAVAWFVVSRIVVLAAVVALSPAWFSWMWWQWRKQVGA